jgi:cyanophycinase
MQRIAVALLVLLTSSCSQGAVPDGAPAGDSGPQVGEAKQSHGPPQGTLVIAGGGTLGPVFSRFVDLCGGSDAAIVVIPTALEDGDPSVDDPQRYAATLASTWKLSNVTALHTRDRAEADDPSFVAPIESADGVWFSGGRQWRFADAYLDTRTERAFDALLARGGVIGGSSAGATIQGSFLARGDTASNTVMVGDHVDGFGFLSLSAIDQHVAQRGREYDLVTVLQHDPRLLGIGLDEDTWIELRGDRFVGAGDGEIYIHDHARWPAQPSSLEELILRLRAGDVFDVARRRVVD